MALTQFKPTTPGRRGLILVDRSDLHKGKPEKSLIEGLRKKGGRNNNGRITARRRGGGHLRRERSGHICLDVGGFLRRFVCQCLG